MPFQEKTIICNIVTINAGLKLRKYIPKILAICLLAVYALSIMPRTILHEIAATHSDVIIQKSTTTEAVGTATFHCALQDQVCTEPGLPEYAFFNGIASSIYISKNISSLSIFHSQPQYSFSLRGPPVFV